MTGTVAKMSARLLKVHKLHCKRSSVYIQTSDKNKTKIKKTTTTTTTTITPYLCRSGNHYGHLINSYHVHHLVFQLLKFQLGVSNKVKLYIIVFFFKDMTEIQSVGACCTYAHDLLYQNGHQGNQQRRIPVVNRGNEDSITKILHIELPRLNTDTCMYTINYMNWMSVPVLNGYTTVFHPRFSTSTVPLPIVHATSH